MPRRLGILGTFVWDTIWTLEDQARGRPRETWGGVAYSLAAGAAARPAGWEIVPIVKVGADLYDEAHRFLDSLPGIGARAGVARVAELNNRVELRYVDDAHRGEHLTGGVPGWRWDELEPALDGLDALFVNFLSGYEMELDAAERLASGFGGPLYADLHSLFLGPPPPDGPRAHRPLPDAERWLRCFDAVQLNQEELAMLAVSLGGEAPGARDLLERGPGLAAVTLGQWGVEYARRIPEDPSAWPALRGQTGGQVEEGHVFPPDWAPGGGDPTGCGDVWGVAFFAGLLAGLDAWSAALRANGVAAAKLGHRGASGLYEHLVSLGPRWSDLDPSHGDTMRMPDGEPGLAPGG